MSSFNPIGDVGRTLRSLLLDGTVTWDLSEEQVALTSPEEFDPDEGGLSIHLYRLVENEHASNQRPGGGGRTADAPLVLELYYLVTAHPPNGGPVGTDDTLEQHRLLSRAIHAFEERAVVRPPDLLGALADGPPLHITMGTGDDGRVMDVVGMFGNGPPRPSVSYRVTPVIIEPTAAEAGPRVVETTMEYLARSDGVDGADGSDDDTAERP